MVFFFQVPDSLTKSEPCSLSLAGRLGASSALPVEQVLAEIGKVAGGSWFPPAGLLKNILNVETGDSGPLAKSGPASSARGCLWPGHQVLRLTQMGKAS